MRYIGAPNPLTLMIGIAPIFLYYTLLTESPIHDRLLNGDIAGILLLFLLTAALVIAPLTMLLFSKIIAIDSKNITLIYPFRLKVKVFNIDDLKSVYQQLNNNNRISFRETHLYFGKEKRLKFNSFEIINFKGLSTRLDHLHQTCSNSEN